MIIKKKEVTINWDEIKIKLDFWMRTEMIPTDKIRYWGHTNQNSDIPAVKFLGVYIDSQLWIEYHPEYLNKMNSRSMYQYIE